MAVFRCKMCGGDLAVVEGASSCTCEFCGTKQTIPTVKDENLQNLFNRANVLRMKSEFDKAAEVYEKILQRSETEAEAYWGLILCKYGIEYVEDPQSFRRVPTCHRASYDAVVSDEDYRNAIKYADAVQRSIYEQQAAEIDAIQKGILALAQKEDPYDVFICYKETDENGKRTQDSVIANDIYYQLTREGFKVFYAAITLEDKLGTEYEPYIFSALNTAKVMLCLGTKPEYFSAVWVKNEWSRFLKIMKKDRTKLLIPCYRDMDPYELPEEFSHLQAQDMSKIGFINDVVRGIKKVLGADKKPESPAKQTVVVQQSGNTTASAQVKRGNLALEDGEWEQAKRYFDEALNINPECGEAYLGQFFAEQECCDAEDCIKKRIALYNERKCETLSIAEDTARIVEAVENYKVEGFLSAEEIRKIMRMDLTYSSALHYRKKQLDQEIAFYQNQNLLNRAERFGQKQAVEKITTSVLNVLKKYFEEEQKNDEKKISELKQTYHDFLDEAESHVVDTYRKSKQGKEEAEIEAKKQAELEKQKQAQVEKENRKRKNIIVVSALLIAVCTTGCLFVATVIIPRKNYNRAVGLMNSGNYAEAATLLTSLKGYKDSATLLETAQNEALYKNGVQAIENENFSDAITIFTALDGYKDSATLLKTAQDGIAYQNAIRLENEEKYAYAALAFSKIKGYKDSKEKCLSLWDKIAVRNTIAAGTDYTVGLKSDGTVIATGNNEYGQCEVSEWTDIIAISANWDYTVGLKSDGTVVATGYNSDGQCDVSGWEDIVAVSTGYDHTVGLKSDGTVVAIGFNGSTGQCDVSEWKNIIAISASWGHTVGLKSDGTVVATGVNSDGQCDVSGWTDIVAISAGVGYTVGLKSNGKVVATGSNCYGQCDVSDWSNIIALSTDYFTLGLKSDGTVVASPAIVSDWTDITEVSEETGHRVGLKTDGTVIANGDNTYGECNISDWTNIKMPNKMYY